MAKKKKRATIVPIENPATKLGLKPKKILEHGGFWYGDKGKSRFHN